MQHRRRLTSALFTVAAALVACEADEVRFYRTEHLEIEAHFTAPVCAGDLAKWEDLISSLEADLQTKAPRSIKLHLWDPTNPEVKRELPSWCSTGVQGCYNRVTKTIHANLDTVDHELVHAVAFTLGNPGTFFHEGLAEALRDRIIGFGGVGLSISPSIHAYDVTDLESQRSAGEFVRWLIEAYGFDKIRQLMTTRGTERQLAQIYGKSIYDLETEYFADAPWYYPPYGRQPAPLMGSSPSWQETISLDCDNDDIFGLSVATYARRSWTLETAGTYTFWTDADELHLHRSLRTPIVDEAQARDGARGAAKLPDQYRLGGRFAVILGRRITSLELRPGDYILQIYDRERDQSDATVAIWPSIIASPEGS